MHASLSNLHVFIFIWKYRCDIFFRTRLLWLTYWFMELYITNNTRDCFVWEIWNVDYCFWHCNTPEERTSTPRLYSIISSHLQKLKLQKLDSFVFNTFKLKVYLFFPPDASSIDRKSHQPKGMRAFPRHERAMSLISRFPYQGCMCVLRFPGRGESEMCMCWTLQTAKAFHMTCLFPLEHAGF